MIVYTVIVYNTEENEVISFERCYLDRQGAMDAVNVDIEETFAPIEEDLEFIEKENEWILSCDNLIYIIHRVIVVGIETIL